MHLALGWNFKNAAINYTAYVDMSATSSFPTHEVRASIAFVGSPVLLMSDELLIPAIIFVVVMGALLLWTSGRSTPLFGEPVLGVWAAVSFTANVVLFTSVWKMSLWVLLVEFLTMLAVIFHLLHKRSQTRQKGSH